MNRARYQKGSLREVRRADGTRVWTLRYRVSDGLGKRVQRRVELGTKQELKNRSEAEHAASELLLTINRGKPMAQNPTVGTVAKHFKDTELTEDNTWRSRSTKDNYRDNINCYILPRWERTPMLDVEAPAVEDWLKVVTAKRTGKPLAAPTKQRIRNIFSVLFTHAQRHRFIPQGVNPISLVRQSGKRSRIPDILGPEELHGLWFYSAPRERASISIETGNGLRVSEGFALKWSDIDFDRGVASVVKGIVKGHVGDTKTEISKKLVPLHPYQLADLKAWREVSPYPADDDWVFASHRMRGRKPLRPEIMLRHYIRPLASKLGITKTIGWHTFRRTYASLLKKNGVDVKVVQELMRHANPRIAMELYVQAFSEDARRAQGEVVEMVHNSPLPALPEVRDPGEIEDVH